MKSIRAVALCAALLAIQEPSLAAPPKILPIEVNVRAVSPVGIGTLTGSSGDEVSALALTSKSALLVGTVEGPSGDWVASPTLGGTDGFVSAVDFAGKHLWDLRLGGSGDDQASAIAKDNAGYFWIVGSSVATASPSPTPSTTENPSPTPSPSSTAPQPLNPNGVSVTPFPAPVGGLTQLDIWKISKNGLLLSQFQTSFSGVVNPTAISANADGVLITGQIVVRGSIRNFTLAATLNGVFSPINVLPASAAGALAQSGLSLNYGQTTWRTLLSKGPIKGVSNWWPAKPTYVMIASDARGRIVDARSFLGQPIAWAWLRSPGVVLVTERNDGFGLTIVSPLAG